MTKQILFVETGGTFACKTEADGVRELGGPSIFDFEAVQERAARCGLSFVPARPFTILSENMTIRRLEQWLVFLKETDLSGYDGVIVAHGTDTLAYTVNLSAFALGKIGVPLIFIAADHPLSQPRSKGVTNFLAALDLINAGQKGVFAVYRNEDGHILVHRGGRLRQMDDIYASFMSHLGIPFGEILDSAFIYNEHPLNLRYQRHAEPFAETALSRGILRIFPYPGLDYSRFVPDRLDAVLIETYHSATFCTAGEGESLNGLLGALDRQTPVFIVGGQSDGEPYRSQLLPGGNVIFVPDVAPEAFYVKMLLAFGANDRDEALGYLAKNVVGEKVSS